MEKLSPKKLIYFTNSFPFGIGHTWKSNELKFLVDYFDEIIIIPNNYGGNYNEPINLIDGVKFTSPLFDSDISVNRVSILQIFDKNIFYYLEEMFRKRVFLSKKLIRAWLEATLYLKRLLKHPAIIDIIKHPSENTYLYFFWGRGTCDFLPFVDKKAFAKIMVRFHRYDLFEDENEGYIPYRKQLLQSIHIASPSSESGCNHLNLLYPKLKKNIQLSRLGVLSDRRVNMSTDTILRIVSCSYLVPVKRVQLLVEALKFIDFPVEWTHLGDGPLMDNILELTKHLPGNIKINLPGWIKTTEVINYYQRHNIDLFINISRSEGVPFSIMEALSVGIPVFATNAGGTGEIIDDSVGKIFSVDFEPNELASYIREYYFLTKEAKLNLRKSAIKRYEDKCNAEVLTRKFAEIIIS